VGPGDTAWVYMQEEPEEDNEYLDYESSNFSTRDGVASIGSWTSSDTDKITITTTATDPFFGSHSGLITKLAVDAVNAYLPVASAVIPRGNRGKPIIIKMSADFTHANYVSDNLEFQLWDITGTPTQIYVSGDVKIKKAKGDIILVGYPEATCSQVELRAVIATDSATSSSWTGKIDRVQLGPDKLVPSLFFRTEEIDLAGDFTAGTIRVSRVGSQVTISVVQAITVSPAKWNPATATGFIPTWARPTDHATNVVGLGSAAIARVRVDNNGEFKFEQRSIADGSTVNLTTVSGSVISYTVPDTESPLISSTEALYKNLIVVASKATATVTTTTDNIVSWGSVDSGSEHFNASTGAFRPLKTGWYQVSITANTENFAWSSLGNNVVLGFAGTTLCIRRAIGGAATYRLDFDGTQDVFLNANTDYFLTGLASASVVVENLRLTIKPHNDISVFGIAAIDKLNHIGDVEITAPTDGLALVYDGVSNTWKADQVPADGLASNSVTTVKISNLAVTSAKLATGNNERDWVLARTAAAAVGAVGTYAELWDSTTGATRNQGTTLAGSSLRYANAYAVNSPGLHSGARNSSPSGTWMLMGAVGYWNAGSSYNTDTGSTVLRTSLWLRIS
jgi:hypothetical protein